MKGIRSSGNKSTELKLINYFSSNHITGWRRKYDVKGHPDFVFLDRKIAIFVDGCFWHGHEGCRYYRLPKSNVEFWQTKIDRNRARDERDMEALRKRGWRVIVVWECRLRTIAIRNQTLHELADTLTGTYPRPDYITAAAEPEAPYGGNN